MNIAALMLTVVFIADDPTLPMLAMELVEQPGQRQLVVASAVSGASPTTMRRRDAAGRTVLPVGAFPMGPAGTSVRPAVDGVIVTIDDVASLVAAFNPPPPVVPVEPATTTKKPAAKPPKPPKAPPSVHPWPPPSLPVLGPSSLRLFLPAIVDGEPMSASLHGPGGQAIPGFAVAFTHVVDDAGIAVVRAEADIEVAVPRFVEVPATCAVAGGAVLLRQTGGAVGAASCDAGFEVRAFSGMRSGDLQAKDRPARGLILRRAPPAPTGQPRLTPPLQTPPVKVPALPIAPATR